MSNYIILENRAELTTAQVLGGMNFSAIVAGAASATSDAFGGKSFGTGFMSKGFLAVLIVIGGVTVYRNYTSYTDGLLPSYSELNSEENVLMRKSGKGPLLVIETIPPKNNKHLNENPNMACQPGGTNHDDISNRMTTNSSSAPLVNIDSLIAIEDALKSGGTNTKSPVLPSQMVQPPQHPISCRKGEEMVPNGMVEEPKTFNATIPFKASANAKSYLWNPASFNHNVEVVPGELKLNCNDCDFNYISGSKLDNMNYKGVWVHVTRDKKIKFKLESGLKNISLIRTEGSKSIAAHPLAIGIGGPHLENKEWNYISNKFKAVSATYHFGDHIDFYLIFDNAKAGDKLVIDDFVETVVVEK